MGRYHITIVQKSIHIFTLHVPDSNPQRSEHTEDVVACTCRAKYTRERWSIIPALQGALAQREYRYQKTHNHIKMAPPNLIPTLHSKSNHLQHSNKIHYPRVRCV